MEYDKAITGQLIKIERIKRGLEQSELAKLSGIAQPQLSRYENAQSTPSFKSVQKIADAFGIPIFDLVTISHRVSVQSLHDQLASAATEELIEYHLVRKISAQEKKNIFSTIRSELEDAYEMCMEHMRATYK